LREPEERLTRVEKHHTAKEGTGELDLMKLISGLERSMHTKGSRHSDEKSIEDSMPNRRCGTLPKRYRSR